MPACAAAVILAIVLLAWSCGCKSRPCRPSPPDEDERFRSTPVATSGGRPAGFGGGGVHGYAALEGTFLGGCIFSGRGAGRATAKGVR